MIKRFVALVPKWIKNALWKKARAVPSLDLQFADRKDLVDATTGANLVTFTRASSGTYVDSQGVVRTATTNLLLRSEEFDNASWTTFRANVSPNATAAPSGLFTADKLVEDTTASNSHLTGQLQSFLAGALYSFSIYVKAAERSQIRIALPSSAFGVAVAYNFDLQTGTVSLVTGGTADSASIAGVGNGWFRCVITAQATASAAGTFFVYIAVGGFVTYTGDGTSGIYLWGAQLEQSSTVGEYVPTGATINSAPRFDHNPTTGESLGLLVEEARTNLCLQSEAFGTSPWAASNVTVTANTETSPAATLTADTLAATSANGTVTQPVTTTAVAMTFSVYLKRKTGTGNIDITADGTTWVTQTINSSTWTRCIVTQTAVAGTSNPGIRIVTSGDEVYAWGGQYE